MDLQSLEPMARLPLRAELFLIAHDDDTGEPHLHPAQLSVGLAGALLLELLLAHRVAIGWVFDPRCGRWVQQAGQLTIADDRPLADPLSNVALAAVAHARRSAGRGDQVRMWLRQFTTPDLYERVRANMFAAGVLRHTTRRRLGLMRTDIYLPLHQAWATRARADVAAVAHSYDGPPRHGRTRPDSQCAALCGLVATLGLADMLYASGVPTSRLEQWLHRVVDDQDPQLRTVIEAVDAGRGDLAVMAMQ